MEQLHQSKRIQCVAPGKAKAIATKAMAVNGFIQKKAVVLAEGLSPPIRRKRAAKEEEKAPMARKARTVAEADRIPDHRRLIRNGLVRAPRAASPALPPILNLRARIG